MDMSLMYFHSEPNLILSDDVRVCIKGADGRDRCEVTTRGKRQLTEIIHDVHKMITGENLPLDYFNWEKLKSVKIDEDRPGQIPFITAVVA